MLQNRVNPWGELCRDKAYGTLMGNRGVLHDVRQEIVRQSARAAWVTCELIYKGWRRPKPFSTLNNYSELFFLDEVTAFAAGHRPCTTCRRKESGDFKTAWLAANAPDEKGMALTEIDKVLRRERMDANGKKLTYEARLDELPRGTMVELDAEAYAVTEQGLLRWSFSGYVGLIQLPTQCAVNVLTPRSVVGAFRNGYPPTFHATAFEFLGTAR